MQLATRFLVLAAAAAVAAGRSLQGAASLDASEAWVARAQAEAETERRFIVSEWGAVEQELETLKAAVVALAPPTAKANSAIKNEPKAVLKVAEKAKTATKEEPKLAQKVAKKPSLVVPTKTAAAADTTADVAALAGLGDQARSANNPQMLAPMLAMLKGVYQQARDHISELNKKEKLSKEKLEGYEKTHDARMLGLRQELKRGEISDGMFNNITRMENRTFNYFPACRKREHRQYHNMLKLQHASMEKTKMMIDMYQKTIKGGAGAAPEVRKKLGRLVGEMPDIVFVQVAEFCNEGLAKASAARRELYAAGPPSAPFHEVGGVPLV